jgi:hypothetical protein
VLSCVGRGLCDGLITRPEESYRVSVCVRSRNPEKGGHRSILDYKRLWMNELMNQITSRCVLHTQSKQVIRCSSPWCFVRGGSRSHDDVWREVTADDHEYSQPTPRPLNVIGCVTCNGVDDIHEAWLPSKWERKNNWNKSDLRHFMRARSQIIVRCSVSRHSSKANSRLQKYRKNPPSKKTNKQQWEVSQHWKHLFPRCVLWRLSIPLVGLRVYLLMINIFFCFVNFFTLNSSSAYNYSLFYL